jgi:hypothetical protein
VEYVFLLATSTEADVPPEHQGEAEAWAEEGVRRGIRKDGIRLRPVEDATTVCLRNGQVLVTDGPFAKSKEWVVGCEVVECDNLDDALDYASRHPMARFGRIEIRPSWPEEPREI